MGRGCDLVEEHLPNMCEVPGFDINKEDVVLSTSRNDGEGPEKWLSD